MIEEYYARSESDAVTFSFRAIAFSASLVKKHGLDGFDYIRVGIDSELRRLYFSFQKDPAPGLSRFSSQKRSKRKMIAIGQLYTKYDWLNKIRDEKVKAKKQFILEEVDPNNQSIYPKYKFFITIGYSWSTERDFNDSTQYPEEPGVYRLKKDGEIVRIGEGINIATRLKEHLSTYGNAVDKFDFEIVPNEEERKKEQNRLLESFKVAVGRLPKNNPITN